MISLWLIEGLRRRHAVADTDGKGKPTWFYLPLNPLCTTEELGLPSERSWDKLHKKAMAAYDRWYQESEEHRKVLTAYKRWWQAVSEMEPEAAAMYDPLAHSEYKWFGGRSIGKPLPQ